MAEDEYGNIKNNDLDNDLKIRVSTCWQNCLGEKTGTLRSKDLGQLPVILNNGASIPLRDIADFTIATLPVVLVHKDGQRVIALQSGVKGRTAGDIVKTFILISRVAGLLLSHFIISLQSSDPVVS